MDHVYSMSMSIASCVDRTQWLTSAHYFDVPADSRVAWAWLYDVPTHVYGTVHSPTIKSIAVVYEYAFPLLLANKHSPFFFSL